MYVHAGGKGKEDINNYHHILRNFIILCQVSINCLLVNLHLIDHVDYYLKSQEIKISGAKWRWKEEKYSPIHQISPI